MTSPAMSLAYRGDEVFLEIESVSLKITGPYDVEKVIDDLKALKVPAKTIGHAITFLNSVRDHFKRPDILADLVKAA